MRGGKERGRERKLMGFDFLGPVTEIFGPALAPASWIPSILLISLPFGLSQLKLGSSHVWSRLHSRVLPDSEAPPRRKERHALVLAPLEIRSLYSTKNRALQATKDSWGQHLRVGMPQMCVGGVCLGRPGYFLGWPLHLYRGSQSNPIVFPIENGEIQPQEDIAQDPLLQVVQDVLVAFKAAEADAQSSILEKIETHIVGLSPHPPTPSLSRAASFSALFTLISSEPSGSFHSCRMGCPPRHQNHPQFPSHCCGWVVPSAENAFLSPFPSLFL